MNTKLINQPLEYPVDLTKYIFPIIEYDPTENPRGIITADEWNTIMNLLLESTNYTAHALQELYADLYTASQLSSKTLGKDGARLIGVDTIPGVNGSNVNTILRNLKEQLDGVVLGSVPDNSIVSDKLAPNLNFSGDTLTFNNVNIMTENNIVNSLSSESTNTTVPGALTMYNLLSNKQDIITIGTDIPGTETPGNIYLQYIE